MRPLPIVAALVGSLLCLSTGCVATIAGRHDNSPEVLGNYQPVTAKSGSTRKDPDLSPKEKARICLSMADSMYRAGKDVDAIGLYERARAIDPSNQTICRRLAVLYDRQGHTEKAMEEYRRALALYPNNPDLLNDVGYSAYGRGQLEEAEKHLRRALVLAPKHERASINLGLVLAQKGRYEESLASFGRVVSRGQSMANLAFVLTAQGKKEEARRMYQDALMTEPDLSVAKSALAKLEANPSTAPGGARYSRKLEELIGSGTTTTPVVIEPVGAEETATSTGPTAVSAFIPATRKGSTAQDPVPIPPLPHKGPAKVRTR